LVKDYRIIDAIDYFNPSASSALNDVRYGYIGIIAPVLSPGSSLGLHTSCVVDALEGTDGTFGGFSVDAANVGCF
jgi:hypothetical protein